MTLPPFVDDLDVAVEITRDPDPPIEGSDAPVDQPAQPAEAQ